MYVHYKEIDFLKCIFITLMVVFHLVYIGDKYPYAKQIVYTFHMSSFLIISGYLTNIDKCGKSFFRKFLWIFIPYACMETGYVIMSHLLPVREIVTEISPMLLLDKIFLKPMGPYWYLHTLIFCSIVYYSVFRCVQTKLITKFIVLGITFFLASQWGGLMAFNNAIYFFIGVLINQSKISFTSFFRSSFFAVIPLVWLCSYPANLNKGALSGVVITYLAISVLLYIQNYIPCYIKRSCCFIGNNTFLILLFSPVFTIISKIFLPVFSFDPTGMLFLVTATAFTISGCMGIGWIMDKWHLSKIFYGKEKILKLQNDF